MLSPVLPTYPITCPAVTASPAVTAVCDIWAYRVDRPAPLSSKTWLPELLFQPEMMTVPLWAARIGVPSGAGMSVTQYPAPYALDGGACLVATFAATNHRPSSNHNSRSLP